MGLHHRKLILGATNSTLTRSELVCASFCEPESELNASGRCPSECLSLCSTICRTSNKPHKSYTFLIVSLSLVAAALLLGFGYFFYVKYYSRRRSQPQSDQGTHDNVDHEFIDEDLHGPVLDHPIWYINTVGLQQSIISSITVCQYKKGDGLVEGTECAVCLSEFQEDETLRLLPKCNHAFHVPCVDTWLRSHTNCPMCRAPIVKAVGTPTPESNLNSIPEEETQVEILENSGESSGGMETEICEIGVGTEELDDEAEVESPKQRGEISTEVVDVVEPRRRSVSMDSSSASKINLALSNVHAVESNGNSNSQLVIAVNKSNRGTGPKRIGGNQKLQRQKGNSSKGRSLQSGPLIMKRSSSSDGKFPFCRDVQNSDSVFPLRSF